MKPRVIAVVVVIVASAGFAVGVGSRSDAQEDQPPAIDRTGTAEEPVPVASPPGGAEVLVAVFDLNFEEGTLQSSELRSAERIASFNPKVNVADGGEWRVTTEGEGSIIFFTWDPGWQEAEADPESDAGFEWIPITGSVEWVLVVPLSDGQERIDVQQIIIVDTRTEEVVIDTSVE